MFSKLKWFYHSSAFKLATTLNLVFVALLVLTWIVTREVVDEALYNRAETELLVRMKNLINGLKKIITTMTNILIQKAFITMLETWLNLLSIGINSK